MRKKGFKHSQKTRQKMSISATKHGFAGSKIYNTWKSMITRCTDEQFKQYSDYGGRGITVCERWKKFENFLEDMEDAPRGKSLDRIDNEKGYSKENCRWASEFEQKRNTRRNHWITFNGKTRCLQDWAESIGIKANTLINRLNRSKWPLSKALTTPSLRNF